MTEIVNLRQFKKAKARAANEKRAAANRAKFGATQSEKAKRNLEALTIERALDGAQLSIKTDDESA